MYLLYILFNAPNEVLLLCICILALCYVVAEHGGNAVRAF